MKQKYVTIPNILTFTRLLGGLILVFLKPLQVPYMIVYTIAGVTDCFDGFVARKLNQTSEFGSKLDSVADLTFFTVMMIKILPFLIKQLPLSIWNYVTIVLIVRVLIYIINAIRKKGFLSSHSYLNKATGAMLFVLPYFVGTQYLEPFSWMLVGVSIIAAIWEFLYSILKIK